MKQWFEKVNSNNPFSVWNTRNNNKQKYKKQGLFR